MCGIFGTNKYNKLIKKYNKQRSRGSEGFGVLNINNTGKVEIFRETEEKKFIELLGKLKEKKGKFCFVHHRYPTSTKNYKSQTHPILVSSELLDFDYYVMHNGVISNTDDLKEKHDKLGFDYSTLLTYETKMTSFMGKSKTISYDWNDSNSLAVELARFIENDIDDLDSVKGSFAFIVVQVDKKSKKHMKTFVGRNSGNPLKIDDVGSFGSEIGTSEIVAGSVFELNLNNMGLVEHRAFTDNYTYKSFGYSSGSYGGMYGGGYDDDITSYKLPSKQVISQKEIEKENGMWENYEIFQEELEYYPDSEHNTPLKKKVAHLLDDYVCSGKDETAQEIEYLLMQLESTGDIMESNKDF